MITRKIQFQNGSYFSVIPKTIVDMMGISPGDRIAFDIDQESIRMTPATKSTMIKATGDASAQDRHQHGRK